MSVPNSPPGSTAAAPVPTVIDRALLELRLVRRSAARDWVSELVLDDLRERLLAVSRAFGRAAIMGPVGAILPETTTGGGGPIRFARFSTALGSAAAPLVNPEALVLPGAPYDLVVSVLDLQSVNDIPGFLGRVRAQLAPDGLFLGATLGGSTLSELRQAFLLADAEVNGGAFARVAPFIEVRDGGALLQRAGFALPVADLETHLVRYADPLALLGEIRALGATNPLADRPGRIATPRLLARALANYQDRFADPDGRIRATLDIVWLSGWAPHASQQQPLAPGSAQVSLAAVLGRKP